MSYNLDDLLNSMEQATGMVKSASAEKPASVVSSLESVLAKKASKDLVKEAQEQGAALAKELLTKVANEIQIKNDTIVAEQAAAATPTSESTVADAQDATLLKALASGATTEDRADQLLDQTKPTAPEADPTQEDDMQKLAAAIFEKLASEAEVATNPIVNKLQQDAALQDAQATAKVTETPQGPVNEVLQAIVAKAQASGAGSDDVMDGNYAQESAAAPVAAEAPEEAPNDEQEKVAAVNALVGAGFDFDSAVSMVKQAEAELIGEAADLEKKAAFDELLAAGVDFDSAVSMVKEAALALEDKRTASTKAADKVKSIAGKALGAVKAHPGKAAAIAGALGGAAFAAKKLTEKKAAFDELLAAGVDFDSAAQLVKQASLEVYGE